MVADACCSMQPQEACPLCAKQAVHSPGAVSCCLAAADAHEAAGCGAPVTVLCTSVRAMQCRFMRWSSAAQQRLHAALRRPQQTAQQSAVKASTGATSPASTLDAISLCLQTAVQLSKLPASSLPQMAWALFLPLMQSSCKACPSPRACWPSAGQLLKLVVDSLHRADRGLPRAPAERLLNLPAFRARAKLLGIELPEQAPPANPLRRVSAAVSSKERLGEVPAWRHVLHNVSRRCRALLSTPKHALDCFRKPVVLQCRVPAF